RRRFFRHCLLPLLFLTSLVGQYLLWSVVTPPLPAAPRPPRTTSASISTRPALATSFERLLPAGHLELLIPPPPKTPEPPPEAPVPHRARVAIIIDDLGFVREATEAFWELE